MATSLSEQAFFDPDIPATWEPVLVDLQAFMDLVEELHRQGKRVPSLEQQTQLTDLHDRLVSGSATLLEPETLADLSETELAQLFARSVCFLTRLKECVAADQDDVLDTAGSRTLALCEADFYRSPENLRALRMRLQTSLELSHTELDRIEAEVEDDLADARRKQLIIRALREVFALRPSSPDLRHAMYALFCALYPEAPILPEEVELILTGTAIFFCLPFQGEELTSARFRTLSEVDQRPIRNFLRKINAFTQAQFAHFPAFGFFTGDRLDPRLLERLASHTGLPPAEVAREISCLVTILPLAEVDKYVVHDVWGHGWQASMLRFEEMYSEMAGYADPLRLGESAPLRTGGRLTLAECFPGPWPDMTLDNEMFRRFVHALLADRLPVTLSAVLAEMMADVAEYKFLTLHPSQADWMPSSSLFKLFPTKLDLTLRDVQFYFGQATKIFRLWAKDSKRRERTRDELIHAGWVPAAAGAMVECAVQEWEALARGYYAPCLWWEPVEGGRLRVNAFTRVALNFLGIHRAILETYRRLEAVPPGALPLKSYKDLLVIGASVFFEADRPRNLWRVDEYLSLRFVPLCRRVGLGA
ncbi:MAG: hypothetical protein HYZ89_01270 [Candidatus Omnitrophica bacterium]|nr:hypothetical protein [Candidatus Omnitrophota bacterium]